MKTDICSICGDGKITILTELLPVNTIQDGQDFGEIRCQFKSCDVCGSKYADSEDMKINKEEMNKYRENMNKGNVWN